jgi:hypothetical protein
MGRDTEAPRRGRKAAARAALLMLALPLFAQSPPGDYADEEALPPGKRGDRIQQVPPSTRASRRPSKRW